MALIKTSNPALSEKIFQGQPISLENSMTLDGTVNKTAILLLCAIATAAYSWHVFMETHSAASVSGLMFGGAVGGLIVAMITIFRKEWAAVTAPIYSLLEGLVLGSISATFEIHYPGIAIQSVAMTFGVMLVMLFAYRSHIIPVTQKLRLGIVAATGAIAIFYVAEIILSFFGIQFATINGSGPLGIGFSIVVVAIAALNLVLDF